MSRAMPKLLFVTVPTDEVLGKEGKVRFPGTEAAVEELTEAGWDVEVCDPLWPKPLERRQGGQPRRRRSSPATRPSRAPATPPRCWPACTEVPGLHGRRPPEGRRVPHDGARRRRPPQHRASCRPELVSSRLPRALSPPGAQPAEVGDRRARLRPPRAAPARRAPPAGAARARRAPPRAARRCRGRGSRARAASPAMAAASIALAHVPRAPRRPAARGRRAPARRRAGGSATAGARAPRASRRARPPPGRSRTQAVQRAAACRAAGALHLGLAALDGETAPAEAHLGVDHLVADGDRRAAGRRGRREAATAARGARRGVEAAPRRRSRSRRRGPWPAPALARARRRLLPARARGDLGAQGGQLAAGARQLAPRRPLAPAARSAPRPRPARRSTAPASSASRAAAARARALGLVAARAAAAARGLGRGAPRRGGVGQQAPRAPAPLRARPSARAASTTSASSPSRSAIASACEAPGLADAQRVGRRAACAGRSPRRRWPRRGGRARPLLQPGVVGGRQHQRAALHQAPRAPPGRAPRPRRDRCRPADLVEQHQRARSAPPSRIADQAAHVGREGGEAAGDRLLVADVGQHPVEDRQAGAARPAPAGRTGAAARPGRASSAPRSCRRCSARSPPARAGPPAAGRRARPCAGSSSGWRAPQQLDLLGRLHRAAAPAARQRRRSASARSRWRERLRRAAQRRRALRPPAASSSRRMRSTSSRSAAASSRASLFASTSAIGSTKSVCARARAVVDEARHGAARDDALTASTGRPAALGDEALLQVRHAGAARAARRGSAAARRARGQPPAERARARARRRRAGRRAGRARGRARPPPPRAAPSSTAPDRRPGRGATAARPTTAARSARPTAAVSQHRGQRRARRATRPPPRRRRPGARRSRRRRPETPASPERAAPPRSPRGRRRDLGPIGRGRSGRGPAPARPRSGLRRQPLPDRGQLEQLRASDVHAGIVERRPRRRSRAHDAAGRPVTASVRSPPRAPPWSSSSGP